MSPLYYGTTYRMPRKASIRLNTSDPQVRLATVLPLPVAEHLRAQASRGLTSVSALMRAAIVEKLRAEGRLIADDDADHAEAA